MTKASPWSADLALKNSGPEPIREYVSSPGNDFMNPFLEIEAFLPEGQSLVLPTLHGVIHDCGGWVLNRQRARDGLSRFVFEFPRDLCVEIYSALISLGLDLAPPSHRVMAELCRCTPYLFDLPSRTVTAVDEASLDDATRYLCSLEIVEMHLQIQFVSQAAFDVGGSNAA